MTSTATYEVKQSSYGLTEVKDFISIFAPEARVVSELTLPNRELSFEELEEKYPNARELIRTYGKFRDFLKHTGTKTDRDSVLYRAPHLTAIRKTLAMVSRMQFSAVANGVIDALLSENVGWGVWKYELVHSEGEVVGGKFTIGGEEIDLSEDVPVSIIGRNGRIISGLVITDLNKNRTHDTYSDDGEVVQTKLLPNPALKLHPSNYGNQDVLEAMRTAMGSVSENDPTVHYALSPLDAIVMRIDSEENQDKYLSNLDTIALEDLDYHPDISFLDYSEYLEKYHLLKETDQLYDCVDFAFKALFRWGIMTPDSWEKCTQNIDAILDATNTAKESETESIYDTKLVDFIYEHFATTDEKGGIALPPLDKLNRFVHASDYIPNIAASPNASVTIFPALIIGAFGAPELAILATQSKSIHNRRLASIPRTTIDIRALVRLKSQDDWEIIDDFVSPVDVLCIAVSKANTHIVQYNVESVGVSGKGEPLTEEQKDYRKRLLQLNEDMTLIREDLRSRGLLG